MVKKILISSDRVRQEQQIGRYMQAVRELGESGVSRRELMKMGLAASVGGLVGLGGKDVFGSKALAATSLISPPCNYPWTEALYIPPVVQPLDPISGLNPAPVAKPDPQFPLLRTLDGINYQEARVEEHQRWGETWAGVSLAPKPKNQFELWATELPFCFYPYKDGKGEHCHVWTYVDASAPTTRVAPLRVVARYGQASLVRLVNRLPIDNRGFGIDKISMHLHNAHNAPVSDGGPLRFFEAGQFWDYHYPNIRAGFSKTHPTTTYVDQNNKSWTCPGDYRETLSTLWFHDHKVDFTSQNVYKGLASFYTLFSDDINLDYGDINGDETKGLGLPCGKDYKFDIPLVLADKVFDPTSGELFFDLFNLDGVLGDQQTVNFQIKPFLNVKRRKYRFRVLNGGPSRFYELALSVQKAGQATRTALPNAFWRISIDGNLLPNPLNVSTFRLGVAERTDIIVDFAAAGLTVGDVVFLDNVLEQTNGRGPTGKILPLSENTKLLKFIITEEAVGADKDLSVIPQPTNARRTSMLFLPLKPVQIAQSRKVDFGSSNGAWTVNGKFFDPAVITFSIKANTAELWNLTSGGGWSHPVHIHHEEFQILSRNGNAPAPDDLSRKDVVRIGQAAEGTAGTGSLSFLMQFRDWYGDYPMHCHNVVHEDHSMMIRFEILKP